MNQGITLALGNGITIRSGSMGRLETETTISIPQGHIGIVAIRETYGRRGLFCTSPILWEGFEGCPKIDVANLGANDIDLSRFNQIAHVAIVKQYTSTE